MMGGAGASAPITARLSSTRPPVPWGELGGAGAALSELVRFYEPRLAGDLDDALADALLADLAVAFHDNLFLHSETLALPIAQSAEFVAFCRRALGRIGGDRVRRFAGIGDPDVRAAWLAACGAAQAEPILQRSVPASARQRVLLYGDTADFDSSALGAATILSHKARSVDLFGAHWVFEHNVLAEGASMFASNPIPPAPMRRRMDRGWWRRRALSVPLRLAALSGYAERFRGAWVLADRRDQGADNAEALFRYLHEHRPDVNAWFAVDRGHPLYRAFRRGGAKVVPYGSIRHFVLMTRARIFACSQSDTESRLPFPISETWQFVYLKHGVLHTDHHRRFNPMRIDLVLTATEGEQRALTRDGGGYRFTGAEAELTGMPRHDLLQAAIEGRAAAGLAPDTLLIAPTWRIWLGSKNRDHSWSVVEEFAETDYVREWSALLADRGLRAACERSGLRAAFLMHPRFAAHAGRFDVPDWVELVSFGEGAADLFARSRMLVTDYSSLAFEAAYAGAPTVYFQFDRERFHSGAHSSQSGDFDAREHGFGPVAENADAAVREIATMLDGGHPGADLYRQRIAGLYAHRDTMNRARAVAAIERL